MNSSKFEKRQRLGSPTRPLVTLLAAIFLTAMGCGYPEVSPTAYELAKAIDNLCNLQERSQLPQARALVEQKHSTDEITADEARYLNEILTQADSENWDQAQSMSRRLLEDQLRKQ